MAALDGTYEEGIGWALCRLSPAELAVLAAKIAPATRWAPPSKPTTTAAAIADLAAEGHLNSGWTEYAAEPWFDTRTPFTAGVTDCVTAAARGADNAIRITERIGTP